MELSMKFPVCVYYNVEFAFVCIVKYIAMWDNGFKCLEFLWICCMVFGYEKWCLDAGSG